MRNLVPLPNPYVDRLGPLLVLDDRISRIGRPLQGLHVRRWKLPLRLLPRCDSVVDRVRIAHGQAIGNGRLQWWLTIRGLHV